MSPVIMDSSMSRLSKILILLLFLIIFLLAWKIILFIYTPVDKSLLRPQIKNSLTITDRHGITLSKFYPDVGGSYEPVSYEQLPQHLVHALISTEDKRFFRHKGVDILAVLRAFRNNSINGKIVSGGSTLTQQLIRMIYGLERSYKNKLYEMFLALRYDKGFSKREIITAYLNRAFFGNQIYGIKTAAKIYFGKKTKDMSISESAFLVGLLKSGTKYNPYKYFNKSETRRKYVLSRMLKEGYISKREHDLALLEGVNLNPFESPFKAPHFCFYVKDKIKKSGYKDVIQIQTSLDYSLQKKIEFTIKNNLDQLKSLNVNNGAVVILNAKTGELLCMIGSLDYFDVNDDGQVNGALALRQPGSSLKPFLYAYVFAKGHSPADVTADIRTHIPTISGDYSPVNFDRKYHGPVSIRRSLACSYNIPAVKWLSKYSLSEYVYLLQKSGMDSINKPYSFYGPGIALGTAEVSLLKLAQAYSIFANKGSLVPIYPVKQLTLLSGRKIKLRKKSGRRILPEEIVYLINHILTDRNTRLHAFPNIRGIIYPFDIAYKTGTSKDYRDAWVVGYTKDHIVGIWLGNFRGQPMHRITGGNGAVPLLYDIFLELNPELRNTIFEKPDNIVYRQVCPLSGLLVSKYCPNSIQEIFIKGNEPDTLCNVHRLFYNTVNGKQREKVFAILPCEYDKWCMENDLERPGTGWKPADEEFIEISAENRKINILYPDNGDIFRIDPILPQEYQKIELRASISRTVEYIEWYFNENLWKRIKNGDECKWTLKRGNHKVYVKAFLQSGKTIQSNPVEILVQ